MVASLVDKEEEFWPGSVRAKEWGCDSFRRRCLMDICGYLWIYRVCADVLAVSYGGCSTQKIQILRKRGAKQRWMDNLGRQHAAGGRGSNSFPTPQLGGILGDPKA